MIDFLRRLPKPMKMALFNEGTYIGIVILCGIWLIVWVFSSSNLSLLLKGCGVAALVWFVIMTWASHPQAHPDRYHSEPEDVT